MLRRSRYEKRTDQIFCTRSEKWSENRSSRFEPKISLISFSRGSGPPLRSLSHLEWLFPKLEAKLEAKAWKSLFTETWQKRPMGWLRVVVSLKWYVSFAKEPYKKRRYSAEKTYNFKEPTNRSHPMRALASSFALSFGKCHWRCHRPYNRVLGGYD